MRELYQYLEERNFPNARSLKKKKEDKAFFESLLQETKFITDEYPDAPLGLRLTCVVEGISSSPKCLVCGSKVGWSRSRWSNDHYSIGFNITCSPKCHHSREEVKQAKILTEEEYKKRNEKSQKTWAVTLGVDHPSKSETVVEKRKETNLSRYGETTNLKTQKTKDKAKITSLSRYGVPNPISSPVVQERIKTTCEERYGAVHFFASDEFKAKAKATSIERYGVDSPMKNPEISAKIKKRNIERYGRVSPNQIHITDETMDVLESKSKLQSLYNTHKNLETVAKILGVHFSSVQRACTKLGVCVLKHHMVSKGEREIQEFLEELGVSYVTNNRKIINGELDIVIPSAKVAIEYNGVYWHSDAVKDTKRYHQTKSLNCMEAGYLLIHVWEDDWNNDKKQRIIKDKIRSKLGVSSQKIHARKTEFVVVQPREAHRFMEENHIQGKTTASVWGGLRHNGELVCCMGMKKTKDEGVYDLVRFASSKTVVGGFSKCLKNVQNLIEWDEIFTFAALDYSHGGVYEKSGFTKDHITVPCMWYVKSSTRFRREKYMKHKQPKLLERFDPTLTADENMRNHGFNKLYDAGSIRYSIKNPH